MFQVAIAMAAIGVLMKMRSFWFLSMALGCIGIVFLIQGLI
jgi:hypothetical protein